MERLNQWINLIANIGVIAGIVFLAFEIRVNTNAARTESATSYIANWTTNTVATAMDPEMMAIIQKVNTDRWEAVSAEQRGRTGMYASSQFKSAEYNTSSGWRETSMTACGRVMIGARTFSYGTTLGCEGPGR